MHRILLAGLLYFAVVFAAGFALGSFRVFVLLPHLGEVSAVLLETPVMLTICWIAAGAVIRHLSVSARAGPRLIMGVSAFALLMLAEVLVSVWGLGRTLGGHMAHYATLAGVIGLIGQVIFALIPWLRLSR